MFLHGFKLSAVFDQEKQWVGERPTEWKWDNYLMAFSNLKCFFSFIDDALFYSQLAENVETVRIWEVGGETCLMVWLNRAVLWELRGGKGRLEKGMADKDATRTKRATKENKTKIWSSKRACLGNHPPLNRSQWKSPVLYIVMYFSKIIQKLDSQHQNTLMCIDLPDKKTDVKDYQCRRNQDKSWCLTFLLKWKINNLIVS